MILPGSAQMLMLEACFAPHGRASGAADRLEREWTHAAADRGCAQLLPMLHRRWPDRKGAVFADARRAYLTNWRQNGERMRNFVPLLRAFDAAVIPCILLKGAALVLRYYRDSGVRGMRDLDLLVREADLTAAVDVLAAEGYSPDGGIAPAAIAARRRTGHAWQFSAPGRQSFDLHWRPVVRCFAPEVTEAFWSSAETVTFADRSALVASPAVQLFHVCAHGLQWDWEPHLRWIADALTVLREPIDWAVVERLAAASAMRIRLARALVFLETRFAAPVPSGMAVRLERAAPQWERREFDLLSKPCPLGFRDSARWHMYHFRRIRPHDPGWQSAPAWVAFPQYLATFMGARDVRGLLRALAPELRARAARLVQRASL